MELIYYNTETDFEMEFRLAGVCRMRFLSNKVDSPQEFVNVLYRAVSRNRVIAVVGALDGTFGICNLIANSVMLPLEIADLDKFGIPNSQFCVPQGAMPLITQSGVPAGCLLENEAQSIVLLSDNRSLRHDVMKNLVHPYIKDIALYKGKSPKANALDSKTMPESDNGDNTMVDEAADFAEKSEYIDLPPITEIENENAENILSQDVNVSPAITPDKIIAAAAAVPVKSPEEAEENEEKGVIDFNTTVSGNPLSSHEEESNETIIDTDSDIISLNESIEIASDSPLRAPSVASTDVSFLDDESENVDVSVFENKDVKLKDKSRIGLIFAAVFLGLLLIVALFFGYVRILMPLRAKAVYKNALNQYNKYSEGLPKSALKKFGKLYSSNKDTAGWLSIGNTDINYPVVSAKKSDKDYYKDHLFNGEYNSFGTPFTDEKISKGSHRKNTVIHSYGNWSANLLQNLNSYTNIQFYKKSPVITFDTLYSEDTWKIFSAFSYETSNTKEYEKTEFNDNKDFLKYIKKLKKLSEIETSVDIKKSDEIVTIINTSIDGTTVVAARKTRNGESPLVDVSEALSKEDKKFELAYKTESQINDSPLTEIENEIPTDSTIDAPEKTSGKNKTVTPDTEPLSQAEINNNLKALQQLEKENKQKTASNSPSSSSPSGGNWLPLTATKQGTGEKITGTAIEIISQICAAEMSNAYHPEALKAQAIAAYNWMLCNGGANGKYPTVPMKTPNQKIINDVTEVAGKTAYYGNNIAQLYYYSYSAGVSANCNDVWTANLPYLRSVDSSVDKSNPNFVSTCVYKASDVAKSVKAATGIDLLKVPDKNNWFHVTYMANGPYAKSVTFGNDKTVYKGIYLRNSVFTALKSHAYIIVYDSTNDSFTFTVKGYGHGVGMSQYGANQYANAGHDYAWILNHYFPGITIK